MAFTPETLQAVGGVARSGKSRTVWSYATTDSEATVNAAGYFADQRFAMRVGDCLIRTQLDEAGAHVETGIHVAVTKTPSSVTFATVELNVTTSTGMPLEGGAFTGLVGLTVNDAVTCAGANLAAATLLTKQFNRLGTCGANEGAKLHPDTPIGAEIIVLNDTANDAKIYPPTGSDAIGADSAGTATVVPAGLTMKFRRVGESQWRAYS